MPDRRPLYPRLAVNGNLPLNLSPAERLAAQDPGLPARPKEKHMEPLVSGKFAALAGAIALALAGAAALAPKLGFLPAWAPFAIWCLAAVAAYLAGKALPAFTGTSPTVPLWVVPICLALSAALKGYGASLTPGALQSGVLMASVLVDALAGKAEPPPTVASVKLG